MSEPTTRTEEYLDALAKAAARIADALDRMEPHTFDATATARVVDLTAPEMLGFDEAAVDWGILPPAVDSEPDPLDENDHRDRLLSDGVRLTRYGYRNWRSGWGPVGRSLDSWAEVAAPLTFAPESAPEPDPLDESDHRDRIDRDGDRWFRVGDGHWHCRVERRGCDGNCGSRLTRIDALHGPLTFAPESDA